MENDIGIPSLDVIRTIIAALAFMFSLVSLAYTHIVSCKQKRIKLRENYYEPVFKKMMTEVFPEVFTDFVNLQNGKIYKNSATAFEDAIGTFREKLKFMQFTDIKRYTKIDSMLLEIDDTIVILYSKDEIREEKIEELFYLMKQLYSEIDKYFL